MNIFITGRAGFVGCNLAQHHLQMRNNVTIFDNLSRPRTNHNLDWLTELKTSGKLRFISNNEKAQKLLGWTPQVDVHSGIQQLWQWVVTNPALFG